MEEALKRLYAHHGRPEYGGPDDMLGTLVRTILSQATTRQNTDRAFGRLIDRFGGDWDRIRRAPTEQVERAIEVGGLAGQKAPRIQAILEEVHEERGEYSLEWLRDLGADEAEAYLKHFKGVGPKTAKFVLMYAGGTGVFPMDTHILRICERLGFLAEGTTGQKAHDAIEPLIPEGERYAAHIVMVKHGREICHARNPQCDACPLLEICSFGQRRKS